MNGDKSWYLWGMLGVVAWVMTGCVHAISDPVRLQADTSISFLQLSANPEAYKDRLVILGGTILETRKADDGTVLEILQKPLDAYEKPLLTDRTQGRFMAHCDTYLDAAVYAKDRDITVAGQVLGARTGKIGEVDYAYPLVSCLEVFLWPKLAAPQAYYGPYPWWYLDDPWYRRPYFRHHYFHRPHYRR